MKIANRRVPKSKMSIRLGKLEEFVGLLMEFGAGFTEQALLDGGRLLDICLYARHFIKGRWPEGECLILASGNEHSLEQYARDVLPGNWDEEVASKCTCWMYYYAKDVIKGQLPEELHNRMIWAFADNKHDPWCRKYFGAKKYTRVQKSC